jgi:hypothetical protein
VNNGIRIALWEVNSDNPNSPKFNGIITIDGKEHKVSLWDNSGAIHPRAPRLKGKTSRPSPKEDVSMISQEVLVPEDSWYTLPF